MIFDCHVHIAVEQGALTQADAQLIARHILRENALALYKIG
jgi:hypothetical protein